MAKKSTEKEKYEELVKKIETYESEQKNQKSKKKKLIIALSITVPTLLITGITTAVVLTSSKTHNWSFSKDDYIDLKQKIIESNQTLAELKSNLLNFFKTNLKASSKDISSLIKQVEIIEESEKSITFKVILEKKNNSYSCIQDNKFHILNNELIIEYSGENFIDFPKF